VDILRQAASGAAPKTPSEPCATGVLALHAVASAAACATRGDVNGAVGWARGVPGPLRSMLLADEMETAVILAEETLSPEATARAAAMQSARAWSWATVRKAFVAELIDKAPDLGRNIARHYGMVDQIELHTMLQQLRKASAGKASLESPSPHARLNVQGALDFVRRFGAELFRDADRPTALLYEAFACIGKDRRKAARLLDRALAKGADLIEALRARLLLAMSGTGLMCPDCGFTHGHSAKEAAAAADHLAHALRRDPEAAPLAITAFILAAEGWLEAGFGSKARASILEARARAQALPAFGSRLDVLEAVAIMEGEPNRARALVEAVLEREPTSAEAWKVLILLADREGAQERADALVLEAAAATNDLSLREEARAIREERDAARSDEQEPEIGAPDGVARSHNLAALSEDPSAPIMRVVLRKAGVPAAVVNALSDERLMAYAAELNSLMDGAPRGSAEMKRRVFALLDRLFEESWKEAGKRLPKPRQPGSSAAPKRTGAARSIHGKG
jgi:hypothetical protein